MKSRKSSVYACYFITSQIDVVTLSATNFYIRIMIYRGYNSQTFPFKWHLLALLCNKMFGMNNIFVKMLALMNNDA